MNDVLHRAAKIVTRIVAEENVKPVMEELTHIRGDTVWWGDE
ncbi:MAG: hypothetical protein QXX18_03785 [Candidatus Jordarchaeales archaeon]